MENNSIFYIEKWLLKKHWRNWADPAARLLSTLALSMHTACLYCVKLLYLYSCGEGGKGKTGGHGPMVLPFALALLMHICML